MPTMTDALVHVVDDDEAIRDSLAFLLESAGIRARTYPDPTAFLDAEPWEAPGVLITDVRMPQMNGLELVHALKAKGFALPILMITGHGDVPLAVEAMKAGVADFIEKPFDDEVLLSAIEGALARSRSDHSADDERAALKVRFEALSPRERDVLSGVVAGKANKVIAYDLGISPRTVEVYRAGLMSKTGAASLSELVRMALTLGMGPP